MKNYSIVIILFLLPHWVLSQVYSHSLFVGSNYSGHHFPEGPSRELNGFFDKAVNNSLGYSFGYRADKNIRERVSFGFGVEYLLSKDTEYFTTAGGNHSYFWREIYPPPSGVIFITHRFRYQYVSLLADFTFEFKREKPRYFYLRTGLGIAVFVHGKTNYRNEIRWEDGTNTLKSEFQKDIRVSSTSMMLPTCFYGNIAAGKRFNIGGRSFYGELSYSHDLSASYRDENIPQLSKIRRRILELNIGVQLNKVSK